jgi:hypothetical protein
MGAQSHDMMALSSSTAYGNTEMTSVWQAVMHAAMTKFHEDLSTDRAQTKENIEAQIDHGSDADGRAWLSRGACLCVPARNGLGLSLCDRAID